MNAVFVLISVAWGLVALNHVVDFLARPAPGETRRVRSLIIASYPSGSVMLGAVLHGWKPPTFAIVFGVFTGAVVAAYHAVGRYERWRRERART